MTSTGFFVTAIAEHLATQPDNDVRVLASQPTYAARGTRAAAEERLHNVHVRRFWSPALAKDSVFGRVANLLAFCAAIAWSLIWKLRAGDIVFVVTNPPPLPYIAAWMARRRGAQTILLVHDMYPELMIVSGMARGDSWVARLLHRASTWLYRTASRVVVLGRDTQRLIEKKRGDTRGVVVIPNWGEVDEITPIARTQTAHPERFTVQHAGNMGRGHNVEILVEAASTLPTVHFAFIGTGAKRPWLDKTVKARALQNVSVEGYRPRHELAMSLATCDVAAIAFMPEMSGVSVPSRLYNVMASGRPVLAICEADSELALVVNEERIGWVVDPRDAESLCATIRNLMSSAEQLDDFGRRSRAAAEQRYSRAAIMRQYDALFDEIQSGARSR